jgi:hypothetical protein
MQSKNLCRNITSYAPMIYTAPMRNAFDAAAYMTRTNGRGLGPGNQEFFGSCEMAPSQ